MAAVIHGHSTHGDDLKGGPTGEKTAFPSDYQRLNLTMWENMGCTFFKPC
jgi:hypothetical protein